MSTKTTGRLRVTCIEKAMHISAMLPLAVGGRAFEDMDSASVDIFDTRGASEEYVDWRIPILLKAVCNNR
jgi:hypothetical protein